MPPKQRITRDMILEKSFAMFCKQGMETVNARSVAKTLSCSTQPIFSYFSGMEDLKSAIDQKARELYETSVLKEIEKTPGALGCMRAYLLFAKEQPRLFAHLFLRLGEKSEPPKMDEQFRARMVQEESEQTGLSEEQTKECIAKLWVFTHGMASIMAAGLEDYTPEKAYAMVEAVRGDLILGCKQA